MSGASELTLRIAAAAVLIPTAILAVWLGGLVFATLAAAVGLAVAAEWRRLTRGREGPAGLAPAMGAVIAVAALTLFGHIWAALGVLLIAMLAGWLAAPPKGRHLAAAGVCYASVPVMALIVLRNDPAHGLVATLFVLVVVWATDTGAYAAGRLIGGPRLWPRVSPKKTWAGLAGGVATAALAGVATAQLAAISGAGALALVAGGLAIVAQAGDLGESALKRRFGAKDSGTLIPGHGGVMDRVDGIVTAASVAALLGVWRGGGDMAGAGLLIW